MKKAFLFRLAAVTIFCLATLAIKSESSFCKVICNSDANHEMSKYKTISDKKVSNQSNKYEGFFIRI